MAINPKDYTNKVKTNLWSNKDYKKFYYRFSIEGKTYKGIIDTIDKNAWGKRDRVSHAESELQRIRESKKDNINDKIILDEFMEKHFSMLPDTNWTKTKKSHYKRYISKKIGKKKMIQIRQIHIKETINYQEGLGLAARTVKQTIEILSPAFKEAVANRLILHNPMYGITVKREKTKKIVTDATGELVKIYEAIKKEFNEDPFYYSIYMFALQGRRKSEILNLKWVDINEDYYVIRNTKSGEDQKIFLPSDIKEKLSFLREVTPENEYVFTSRRTGTHIVNIEKTTKKLKDRLGKSFSMHYLRNVIVSAMAENGMGAIYLSGALGHTDPNTVTKYLSMNYMKGSELASNMIAEITAKK